MTASTTPKPLSVQDLSQADQRNQAQTGGKKPAKNQGARRPRTIARVGAVQALFQKEHSGQSAPAVLRDFLESGRLAKGTRFDDGALPNADRDLLQKILLTTSARQEALDAELASVLPKAWPLERLDPVMRALLRAAAMEMGDGVPHQVIINEYVDVAHGFFSGDEPKMVNGALDALARQKAKPVVPAAATEEAAEEGDKAPAAPSESVAPENKAPENKGNEGAASQASAGTASAS
ncbi:transcription antitermination factor NusB [Formicincola oecophyllae]|uniref:Transcription antitermination protein NusB n=1 Tax=Formicincola oecophyllae TaxID=2558361 RepID=A0A4Y6UA06_9PROT|nr:transcription antitermination factor NusB [Formicincola oecophyllae]